MTAQNICGDRGITGKSSMFLLAALSDAEAMTLRLEML